MSDREPPNDQDAERALLGTIVMGKDPNLVEVDPAEFYRASHRRIFEAIEKAGAAGTVDQVSVGSLVPDLKLEIIECCNLAGMPWQARDYVGIVHEKARLRAIERVAVLARAAVASGEDADSVEAQLAQALSHRGESECACSLDELVDREIEALSRPQQCVYLEGFGSVALYGGDLVLIGARPGHGKSALALTQALSWSRTKKVAFYSYEMSASQMGRRVISRFAGLALDEMNSGLKGSDPDTVRFLIGDALAGRDFTFNACGGWAPSRLFSSLRRFASQGGQVVVIDYLQLAARAQSGRLREDVTVFSNNLKQVLLATGLIGVCLSQLRRPDDERALRRPVASELRESGALEQDADVVFLMMTLPSLRADDMARKIAGGLSEGHEIDLETLAVGDDPDRDKRLVVVDAAKVRQGRSGKRLLIFDGGNMTFQPVARTPRVRQAAGTPLQSRGM